MDTGIQASSVVNQTKKGIRMGESDRCRESQYILSDSGILINLFYTKLHQISKLLHSSFIKMILDVD